MTIAIGTGANAYAEAAKLAGGGASPAKQAGGPGFADFVKNAMEGAIDTQRAGEQASIAAAAGKADINSVVAAVTNAEVTLQTVVAVRDKLVQAYQQVLQMPL